MQHQEVQLDSFYVVGITVHTTNLNNQSSADIGALWKRFYEEGIGQQIPAKRSEDLYCVYTDYESGDQGWYRAVLGCKAGVVDPLSEYLIAVPIPQGNYYEFKTTGTLPDSIMQTWNHIWQSSFDRKFTADFDLYPGDGNPVNVFTYLSVH